MHYWWVNQNKTFEKEFSEGFLWAPYKDKGGKSQYHWENVKDLKINDIVFSYAKQEIQAIITVKKE